MVGGVLVWVAEWGFRVCVRDLGLVGKGCGVRGRVCVVARASRNCAACLNLRGKAPVVGRRVSVTVATVTVTLQYCV